MGRTPSTAVEDGLLKAAEEILINEGPDALTVRKVASCAGVAPMGVYNRFNGKAGLLEALFVRGFDELSAAIGEATGTDAWDRLRDAGLRYRRFALQHPEHYRLMFERKHEVEPGPQAQERAHASFDHLVRLVGSARGLQPFGLGGDVEVAQQLWSALHGAVSLELLDLGFDEDHDASFARMLDALLLGMQQQAGRAGHGVPEA